MKPKRAGKRPGAGVVFFATPADFRDWLEKHHTSEREVHVGFYKRDSGIPSITWPESVDAALCYGWIDGVRNSIDAVSYRIRFTPRKPSSTWSAINVRRVGQLTKLGLMRPAGMKAFEARKDDKTGIYAYEQRHHAKLRPADEKEFRAHEQPWAFFQSQPAWYRRTASYYVVSAKQEATRQRRLEQLIADSERGVAIKQLRRRSGKK